MDKTLKWEANNVLVQNPQEMTLKIETNHIIILHKDLDINIDMNTKQIEALHRIIINGISFVKEE